MSCVCHPHADKMAHWAILYARCLRTKIIRILIRTTRIAQTLFNLFHFLSANAMRILILIRRRGIGALGRYSAFQYPDQDAYQYLYAEDFNADTIFHVSVSVKRICLFLPYFKQCLYNIVIVHIKIQHLLSKIWWQVNCFIIYTCPIAMIRWISDRLGLWYIMSK